jgi:UDP:flavonoid glycosyltransferase YjiC (YdhE family)
MGTLGTALHAGIPQLGVPFANDQPDNAARLERLGVARTVAIASYRASRVVRELGSLLASSRYRERAETVAAVVRTERGADDGRRLSGWCA